MHATTRGSRAGCSWRSPPGLGAATFRKLLRAVRPAARGPRPQARRTRAPCATPRAARCARLRAPWRRRSRSALAWARTARPSVITLADEAYPRLLLEITDPPPLLYARGRVELLQRAALAIVGSRNATQQGSDNAEAFARALSDAGLTIVSGLALGIDAAAHRGGLAGERARRSPCSAPASMWSIRAQRRARRTRSPTRGLLISEFPLGTPALGAQFPAAQSPHQRPGARLPGGRSRARLRLADHRARRRRAGARGVRRSGLDPFAARQGLPRADQVGAKLVESAEDVLAELSGFRRSGYASTTAAEPRGAPTRRARPARRTWATIRSMSTRCARAPACRPSRCPPSCCAWSSTGASPRCRAGCTSGWKRKHAGKPNPHRRVIRRENHVRHPRLPVRELPAGRACLRPRPRREKLSAAGFEDRTSARRCTGWPAWRARLRACASRCPMRAPASAPMRRASWRSSTPHAAASCSRSNNRASSTAETRELVIERALAAAGDTLSLEQLKLVVLMVLWNQQTPTSRLVAEDLSARRTRACRAKLALHARSGGGLNRVRLCTYHLRPFAPHGQKTDHRREALRRRRHRARARRLHAHTTTISRATSTCCRRRSATCSSSAPEEYDVKRGKWTFAHLPVIPPHFDLTPIEKTEDAAEAAAAADQAQGRDRARSTPATPGARAS